MAWWKQGLIALMLVVAGSFLWLRFDPGAARLAGELGLPSSLIATIAGTTEQAQGGNTAGGGFRGGGESLVVTAGVGTAAINDRVSAIGDGEAVRSVTVVPSAEGVLEEVRVEPGQSIEAGDVLVMLESDAERIARDQAALDVSIAEDTLERTERLVGSNAASQVQLTNARNALESARLALRDAELKLEKRSVTAPISGEVGLIAVEKGDYVTDQTNIATIDDRSRILVDFWVPERFAPRIRIGQPVEAVAIAVPDRPFAGKVTAMASRIERDSRTLQVRAELDNEEGLLLPGMSFRITLKFEGEVFPAVDPLAIQWSASGPYVWKVIDGKSERTGIRIIQRNSDYVLVTGNLENGDEVVTEGLQSLRPGSALKIARRSDAPAVRGS